MADKTIVEVIMLVSFEGLHDVTLAGLQNPIEVYIIMPPKTEPTSRRHCGNCGSPSPEHGQTKLSWRLRLLTNSQQPDRLPESQSPPQPPTNHPPPPFINRYREYKGPPVRLVSWTLFDNLSATSTSPWRSPSASPPPQTGSSALLGTATTHKDKLPRDCSVCRIIPRLFR